MFTTGRTQPGVPCRHLLLLPGALCGPSAGRIFALSGRVLGFWPVYFCVRFSLVFSLSAYRPKSSFWPLRGHIFFSRLSFASCPACGSLRLFLVSSFGLRPRAAAFRSAPVGFRSAGGAVRLPSRRPFSLFLLFSLGASFPLCRWFLSRFCSLLYFIRFIWVLPFCGCFLIYFYFIFIFFYLSAYRYAEG